MFPKEMKKNGNSTGRVHRRSLKDESSKESSRDPYDEIHMKQFAIASEVITFQAKILTIIFASAKYEIG